MIFLKRKCRETLIVIIIGFSFICNIEEGERKSMNKKNVFLRIFCVSNTYTVFDYISFLKT